MNVNIIINNNSKNDYQKKLEEQMKNILGSSIMDEVNLNLITETRFKELSDKMTTITKKPVWEDFNFRTGKILGILRSIMQNPKQRKELLEVTGLNETILNLYFKYCGNLPYADSNNIINYGRPMDVQKTRELLPVIGSMLGILVESDDLEDITEERWNKLYENALKRAEETVEFNLKNKEEEYEE